MVRSLICAVLILGALAACGERDESADIKTALTSATTDVDQSSTSTTAGRGTTTTLVTTRSTAETTTTMSLAALSAVVIDDVETEEGWRYRISVVPIGDSPESSPGGCVETAPPGRRNLQFAVVVTNLISDRPAPSPQFVVSNNLVGDGSVAATDPFSYETISARTTQNVSEVVPAEPGTACLLTSGVGKGDQSIESGGEFIFQATFGPIAEEEILSFRGGIRVVTSVGQGVEAEFGILPGSGRVIGTFDSTSDE